MDAHGVGMISVVEDLGSGHCRNEQHEKSQNADLPLKNSLSESQTRFSTDLLSTLHSYALSYSRNSPLVLLIQHSLLSLEERAEVYRHLENRFETRGAHNQSDRFLIECARVIDTNEQFKEACRAFYSSLYNLYDHHRMAHQLPLLSKPSDSPFLEVITFQEIHSCSLSSLCSDLESSLQGSFGKRVSIEQLDRELLNIQSAFLAFMATIKFFSCAPYINRFFEIKWEGTGTEPGISHKYGAAKLEPHLKEFLTPDVSEKFRVFLERLKPLYELLERTSFSSSERSSFTNEGGNPLSQLECPLITTKAA